MPYGVIINIISSAPKTLIMPLPGSRNSDCRNSGCRNCSMHSIVTVTGWTQVIFLQRVQFKKWCHMFYVLYKLQLLSVRFKVCGPEFSICRFQCSTLSYIHVCRWLHVYVSVYTVYTACRLSCCRLIPYCSSDTWSGTYKSKLRGKFLVTNLIKISNDISHFTLKLFKKWMDIICPNLKSFIVFKSHIFHTQIKI